MSDESDLFDIYNENRGTLPQAKVFTPERRRKCKTRLAHHDSYFLVNFENAVVHAAQSSFCTGKNDRGWKVTFDYLIANDTNWVKLVEGNFDDGPRRDVRPSVERREIPDEEVDAEIYEILKTGFVPSHRTPEWCQWFIADFERTSK